MDLHRRHILVTITVSWCSPDGDFCRRIVTLRPFTSAVASVTGDVLRTTVTSVFAPLLAPDEDITAILNSVTTDTAAVPMSAFRDRPELRVSCICHVINLIFSDLLTSGSNLQSPELQKMVRDIKAVLVKFAKSSKVRRAYAALWARMRPDEQPLQPIYDVVTRWSSTFHLVVRFMGMWPVLSKMTADQLNFSRRAEDSAWTDLRGTLQMHVSFMPDVAALLVPFFGWTEFFQAGTVTASFVCQAATELCAMTEAFSVNVGKSMVVRDIARAVHAATVARLGSYVNVPPGARQPNGQPFDVRAAIAQLADPRTFAALVVKLTADERAYLERGGEGARADVERDGRFVRQYVFGKKTDLPHGGLFAEIEKRYGGGHSLPALADRDEYGILDPQADSLPLHKEIAHYVVNVTSRQICSDQDVDVLRLVKKAEYQASYPLWSAIQASVLSSAAASAEPERVFSLAATIKSLRRNRLSPTVLEALVLLKSDAGVGSSNVTGPSRLWHQRVATATAILHGVPRKEARAIARTLPPDTPLDQLSSLVQGLANAALARAAQGAQPAQALSAAPAPPAEQDANVVPEDDDEDDEGEVMEKLLDAGVTVTNDGSLLLDQDTIAILEGEKAAPDEAGDEYGDLDAATREAASASVLEEIDSDRRTSARLAAKPRRSWRGA